MRLVLDVNSVGIEGNHAEESRYSDAVRKKAASQVMRVIQVNEVSRIAAVWDGLERALMRRGILHFVMMGIVDFVDWHCYAPAHA